MIIIKGTLIILIVLVCNMLGNIKAKSFDERYIELKKFKRALGIFRSKLEFTYEPINEIFNDISRFVYDGNNNIFYRFIEKNDWYLAVDMETNFKNDDKEVAKGLGKMLGKLDKDGQLNEINIINQFIDRQIEIAFEEKQKNEKLYKVLGKVLGLALVIVLI